MKQCLTCKKTFDDDSLRFCLDDGGTLVRLDDSGVPTMTMPAGVIHDAALPTIPYQEDHAVLPPSDPNQFQPTPPPVTIVEAQAPRPVKLRPVAIGLFVIGLLAIVTGIAKILPGGIGTGGAFAFWGILLFSFSFIRLPEAAATDEPPLSAVEKLAGIFYEPSRVFRNLRSHPHWLAAFLVVVIMNAAYATAFVQRLTPERIVDYTFEKM